MPDDGHDAVIILGAGLWRRYQLSIVLRQRLNTALIYLNTNPDSVAVVTGGLGSGAIVTEAYAMGNFLIQHGINPERVIFEDRSTSTEENLRFARQLLDSHFNAQKYTVVVVTNDFHLPRARLLAWRAGLSAAGKAAPTTWYMVPRYYSREHAALLWHIIFGMWLG